MSKENTIAFKYVGINVRTTKNAVFIDKAGFTNFLLPITITTQRKQNECKPLDEKEMRDFRSVSDQISLLAGISWPDLSFENCILSTLQTKATVKDLIRANKVLSSAKNHKYKIKFSKLNQANLSLAVFHDTSFRNLLHGYVKGVSKCFLMTVLEIVTH